MRKPFILALLLAVLSWSPSASTAAAPPDSTDLDEQIDAFVRGEMERGRILGLALAVLHRFWEPIYVFREDAASNSVLAYGYGWWIDQQKGRRFVQHSGFTGTAYFRDLKTDLAVIVLSNRNQPSGPGIMVINHGIARLVDPTITAGVAESD